MQLRYVWVFYFDPIGGEAGAREDGDGDGGRGNYEIGVERARHSGMIRMGGMTLTFHRRQLRSFPSCYGVM